MLSSLKLKRYHLEHKRKPTVETITQQLAFSRPGTTDDVISANESLWQMSVWNIWNMKGLRMTVKSDLA